MSEDESPTGGQQPSMDYDPNSSIIEKVRSRVSSILPQTLSKWFSPTTGDGSQNGIRKRRDRDDALDRDGNDSQNTEDSDIDEEEENIAPPVKRAKLNPEEHQITESYSAINQNSNRHFLSSTPTTVSRRRHLDISRNQREISCNFDSATTSTFTSSRITERQGGCIINEITPTDVTDKPHQNQELTVWDDSRKISSRRSLNIPSTSSNSRRLPDLRRQPLKKMRYGFDIPHSSHSILEGRDLEEEQEEDASDTEEKTADISLASKAGEDAQNLELTNGVEAATSIVVQVDDASESGDSQCSSLQRSKHAGILNIVPKRLRTSMGSGLNFYTHLEGKKSLFSDKNMPNILNNSTMSLTSLNRRQSFNASLYGSTSALSDSRILNTTSPFYKGRTTYGGASAYSKYSQQAQRTLRTPTLIRPTSSLSTLSSSNNSLAHSSEASTAISNTAKRILELMNQFTSPLTDAKKMANNIKVPALIAHKKRFGESDLLANRAIRMSTPITPYSRPSSSARNAGSKELGPPTNELQVPSMSQLLQMKKLQNNTERVREIANSSKSILNQKEEYKLPAEAQNTENNSSSNKHVSKIKNKKQSTRVSKKAVIDEHETLPAVNLPNIPLPLMKSVPKIDIPISIASSAPFSSSVSPTYKSNLSLTANVKSQAGLLEYNKSTTSTASSSFKISSGNPSISTSAPNLQKPQISTNIQQASSLPCSKSDNVNNKLPSSNGVEFKFSAPISLGTTIKNVEPINNFKFSAPVPISSAPRLDNCKYQPKEKSLLNDGVKTTDCSTSGNKSTASNQLKTGSVLDVLKKPDTVEIAVISKPLLPSISEQFKTSNKWECSDCMIRNDNSRNKCEACEAPKTKTTDQSSFNKMQPPITNKFGDAFKPQSNTWECPICMIRNNKDDIKCIACSASKPGTSSTSQQSSSSKLTSSLVPKPMDTGFKNIVAGQSAKWECSACMTRNEQNRSKCICCEQPKPGAVSDSAPKFSFGGSGSKFTFGFVAQKEDELKKIEESKDKTVTETKKAVEEMPTSFTFGSSAVSSVTKALTTSTTVGFTPTMVTSLASGKDVTDNPSGGFKFGASGSGVQTKVKEQEKPIAGFVFGSNEGNSSTDNTVDTKDKESSGGFKFESPIMSKPTEISPKTVQKDVQQGSAFKPVGGGFTFGATNSKVGVTKANTESLNKSALSFGSSASEAMKITTASSIAQKPDSTAEVKSSFKFGTSSTTIENKSMTDKNPGFSFGSVNPSPVLPAFGSEPKKSEGTVVGLFTTPALVTSTPNSSTTTSFVFGKPSAIATSATPLFGAVSSSTTTATSSTAVSSTPTFGSIATGATVATVAATATTSLFGSATNSSPLMTPKPSFGSSSQQQHPNNNTFGNSFSASTNSTQQNNNQSSNLFNFGAASKTEPNKPVFGSVSSTTNKSFTFGSGATPTPVAPVNTPKSFVFGAGTVQNNSEPTSVFGAVSSNTGSTSSGPLPGFGSFSSPATNTQQPQAPPAFGQPATNTTPFGSSNPPVFGSTPAAGSIFASSTPSFGNPAPAFGATNSTFGSLAAAPTFGSGFSNEGPAAKKPEPAFNFGASAQNTTAAFQFGANNNNNNNKPAFNFSATAAAPSFNFSGNQEAANSSQPFQFGAAPIAPGIFNFSGVETAPNAPFQFSAAAPAANNIFAPTPAPGTPSAVAARRKMRATTRRTQPRQANS